MKQHIEDSIPAYMDLAWVLKKRDIHSATKQVVRRVLQDGSVPTNCLQRAQAMFGKQFVEVGQMAASTSNKDLAADDIKAQGQEVSKQDLEELIQQAKQQLLDEEMLGGAETTAVTEDETTTIKDETAE